jgi:hypothetical protein
MLTYSKLAPLIQRIVPFLPISLSSCTFLAHIGAVQRRCKEEREKCKKVHYIGEKVLAKNTLAHAYVANAKLVRKLLQETVGEG